MFVNDAAARLCGFASGEEMLTASTGEIVSPTTSFTRTGRRFRRSDLPGRLALAGTTSDAIVRFRLRRTGEERWSFISAAPVVDAGAAWSCRQRVSRFHRAPPHRAGLAVPGRRQLGAVASLDYQETLRRVADLAVPQIADWCSVDILGPDDKLEQLAVAHVDPVKA